jgi:preprotein translocase subunit SecG
MLYTILTVVLVFDAIFLIGLILLQQGKGADAGAAFGSGASGTVFGAAGSANFLSRATGILATLFFALALTMAYVARHSTPGSGSIVDRVSQQSATQAPAANSVKPAVTSSPVPAASTHH